MLTDPTIGIDRRALLVGRLRGRMGLRVALAAVAVLYVVGPTLLQWVALDRERAITRGEVWAVEADRPPVVTTGRSPAADRPRLELPAPQERGRDNVSLALAALAGRGAGGPFGPETAIGAMARATGLVAAAWVSVMAGGRLTRWPYRAKHARRSGRFSILG